MCFYERGDIFTLKSGPLKIVDKSTYLVISVSSTEKDINSRPAKVRTAIDWRSVIWKSDLTDEIKRSFFQVAVVSILLYVCTIWTLTKRIEKKHDDNYTRTLEQYWTNPGGNTPQNSSYIATDQTSRKLSKLDEPDMRDTAGKVRTKS